MKTILEPYRSLATSNPGLSLRLGLCALIILTYCPALSGIYLHWDDNVFILENEILNLTFFDALSNIFGHFYHGDYVPLPLLSYFIEINLFGYSPFVQHVTQILLHVVNTWLLFGLLEQFYDHKEVYASSSALASKATKKNKEQTLVPWNSKLLLIFVICFIFAVHPVQVESVAWISERKGLLSTLFLFLSIRAYLSIHSIPDDGLNSNSTSAKGFFRVGLFNPQHRNKSFAYLIFYFLSLLNKMTGVFLPFALIAFEILYFPGKTRKFILVHLPLLIVGAGMSLIRIIAYSHSVPELGTMAIDAGRLAQVPAFIFAAMGYYLKFFFLPFGLSAVYDRFTSSSDATWMTAVPVLFTFGVWIMSGKEKRKRANSVFWAVFLLMFLLPVLQIVPRINFINDRYLYLPVIGFAGISAALIGKQLRWLAYPFLIALPILSFFRSQVWQNDYNLWSDTAIKTPNSSIAHNNLALHYLKVGMLQEAVSEFEKVLILGKDDGTDNLAYSNLGSIYSTPTNPAPFFDPEKGLNYFKRGIAVSRKLDDTFALRLNLALAYLLIHDKQNALDILIRLEKEVVESSIDQKYLQILVKTRSLIAELTSTK